MNEQIFRYLFGLLFLIFIVGQTINVVRATRRGGDYEYREKHHLTMQVFRKSIGIFWFLAIILYIVKPESVEWAAFSMPMVLRQVGLFIGVAGILLVWWTELTLGENFNTTLHVRDKHELITRGPYRYVRHPMYTAIALFGLGMFVLAPANWLIMLPGTLGFIVLMIVRIKQEEAVMLEQFGDDYSEYMDNTGRFLPRLKRG